MKSAIVKTSTRAVNNVLARVRFKLIRTWDNHERFQDFIPFQQTIDAAGQAGLSVGDYIDQTYNVPGTTAETVRQVLELSGIGGQVEAICEIGPGSGRYLARFKAVCQPERYEIYETSEDWRDWL